MSDRFRRHAFAGLCLATLLCTISAAAFGQTSAELAQRLAKANAAQKTLRDSARALKLMIDKQIPPDSFHVGAITVLYAKRNLTPAVEEMLRAAVQAAAATADSEYGDAARLPTVSARIVVERSLTRWRLAPTIEEVTMSLFGNEGRLEHERAPISERKLEANVLNLVGTSATRGVAHNVVAWAGYWTPSGAIHRDILEDAALSLATSNATVARACYAGSVFACESALGLTVVRDSLREWYSPDGWRALIELWSPDKKDKELLAQIRECVDERNVETCERLARSKPVPAPLIAAARSTLLGLAIERGGNRGFSRLLAAQGTPAEVLAATANESIDGLIREWRTRVLAAMPASGAPSSGESGLIVLWAIAFAFIATTRRP